MVYFVTNTQDSGTGSLRQAIALASSGDTIKFKLPANSTIGLQSKSLEILAGKSLTIDGAGVANLTISGNNLTRIFQVYSNRDYPTTLTINNLTLTQGKTSYRGGAVNTEGELPTLNFNNVNFTNNIANQGGGAVYVCYQGNLTINNSSFRKNIAVAGNDERGGGAIAFYGPNKLTVRNSEFVDNRGINGGAINNLNGELLIEDTKFINNQTTDAGYLGGNGGAIFTDRASSRNESYGSVKIYRSVFQNNKGKGEGGAVYLYTGKGNEVIIDSSSFENNQVTPSQGGSMGNGGAINIVNNEPNQGTVISNSTFANNTATSQGGAIWKYFSPAKIINSTFYNNKAENLADINKTYVVGGAVAFYGPAEVINSTFANNHAAWVAGAIAADSNNVKVKNTVFYYNTAANGTNNWQMYYNTNKKFINGGNNIQYPDRNGSQDIYAVDGIKVIDPKLAPLQNNGGLTKTMALLSGSPIIDQGVTQNSPTIDQRGNVRLSDGKIDIGAYEAKIAPFNAQIAIKQDNWITDNTTETINFGVTTAGRSIIKTFQIKNTSNNPLYLGSLQIPPGFSLVGNYPAKIAPLGQALFRVKVDGNTAGNFAGQIFIYSNDKQRNPFNFPVKAKVLGVINGTNGNDKLNEMTLNYFKSESDDLLQAYQGNDTVFGQDGNDTVNAGAGNDVLWGGSGNDSLIGGSGNDTYFIDSPQDIIQENSTNTTEVDTVSSIVNYSLTANVEKLFLSGSSIINAKGNPSDNMIFGNQTNNQIEGFQGKDFLAGNEGDDTLIGGTEKDSLSGGAGNDTFYLNTPEQDLLSDFQVGKDKILVSSSLAQNKFIPGSNINANQLVLGSLATGNQAQFLYNINNGELLLDQDGINPGLPVALAIIGNKPLISNRDILIVA